MKPKQPWQRLRENRRQAERSIKLSLKNASVVSSVAQSCPTLCDPMNCSMPNFSVHHQSQSLLKLVSLESVVLSNHLILCLPLLILPSIFPRIRVFSNLSVLCIRWSKYWSFSFSISPSNEYGEDQFWWSICSSWWSRTYGLTGGRAPNRLRGRELLQYKAHMLHAWRPELSAEASQTFAGWGINETGISISGKCDTTQDFLKARRTLRDHIA